jgi:acetoacetate decarboxylase
MFENLTDPILSGREELGFPKLYSDIHISTGNENDASTCEARISWRGAEWATFRWHGLREQPQQPDGVEAHDDSGLSNHESNSQGLFVHKCVPASDEIERRKGRADMEYDVFIPSFETGGTITKRVQKAEHAEFQLSDLSAKELPTLHHIVSRLAEMPVFEVVEASIVEAERVGDLSGARRIG